MNTLYSVKEICNLLRAQKYTTACGYYITHKDVLKSLETMNRKHNQCQWIDYSNTHPKITYEGYAWLCSVYFGKTSSLIDADILFFEKIIENYRQICDDENVRYNIQPFIKEDMTYDEFAEFVNRKRSTVKKAFNKLPELQKHNSYFYKHKFYIASSVCDELCRHSFKRKYLEYLEDLFIHLKDSLLEKGIEVTYD